MGKRTWTPEQIETLKDLWGTTSYRYISKRTCHTETAIRLKAKRLGLGSVKDASDYMCAREIARAMGIDVHTVTDYWIGKLGMKCRRIKSKHKTLWVMVRHDELMKFLEIHQDKWDSRRIEPYALGMEPEWFHKKRLKDRMR